MPAIIDQPVHQNIKNGQTIRLIGRQDAKTQVLCFHGGGGVGGDPAMLDVFATAMTTSGDIRMAMPQYRVLNSSPKATVYDMFEDAKDALVWAKGNLNSDAIWVMGASFGGLLALDAVLKKPDRIAGLILLNPVTHIGSGGYSNAVINPQKHGALSPLRNFKDHPALAKLRCLILHGTDDTVVPVQSSRDFAAIWPKDRCDVIEVPNATHGFFNRPPRDVETAAHIQRFIGLTARRNKPDPIIRSDKNTLPKEVRLLCCVGAQKAGTSWLFDQITQSSKVHKSRVKERHYFDVLWLKEGKTFLKPKVQRLTKLAQTLSTEPNPKNAALLRQIDRLSEQIAPFSADHGDHRPYINALIQDRGSCDVVCDFTPSYCGLEAEHFRQISAMGDVRFIYILRDPVARMWSQIRMKIAAEGGPDMAKRCAAHAIAMCQTGRMSKIYRADYERSLQALDSGAKTCLIEFYETLFEQDTFDRISAFAGIETHPIETSAKVNQGPDIPLPKAVEQHMLDALAPQYDAVIKRFGDRVPLQWRERLARHTKAKRFLGRQIPVPIAPRTKQVLSTLKTRLSGRSDGPQIAFLHIPKTAGQSIIQELRRHCGHKSISPIRTHTQAADDAQFPDGYRVYAGHLDWVDLETLNEDRFSFSVLRNPKERVASFYFYLLREAKALSAQDLDLPQNTGKRNILNMSPDDYFFAGSTQWQNFIQDHYNNFYCSYFSTRRIRGWGRVRKLTQDALIEKALKGTRAVSGIYGLGELDRLESDLSDVLGGQINIQTTRVNAGPPAQSASRWGDLMGRMANDENRAKMEDFVQHDNALMCRLGLQGELS